MKINKNYFKNKTLLITGGTGSIGNAIVDYFIKYKINLKKIIIYSRDEWKQYEMESRYKFKHNQDLRFYLGDVRDKDRLSRAIYGVDLVIHAAALKHVDKAELDPMEAIKTNIDGAKNVIDCCLDGKVINVIALSTDKASSPINLYGATKLCSDKMFISANNIKGNKDIKLSVVRYGNVLNSRGSVLPLFLKQSKNNSFTITDPKMTRFLITLGQSVELILTSMQHSLGSEIFIPKLPSFKIVDLAKSLNSNAKIKIIGIRPGEKLHEELISFDDSKNIIEQQNMFVLVNPFAAHANIKIFEKFYKRKKIKKQFQYNSLDNKIYLDEKDLKNTLSNLSLDKI